MYGFVCLVALFVVQEYFSPRRVWGRCNLCLQRMQEMKLGSGGKAVSFKFVDLVQVFTEGKAGDTLFASPASSAPLFLVLLPGAP